MVNARRETTVVRRRSVCPGRGGRPWLVWLCLALGAAFVVLPPPWQWGVAAAEAEDSCVDCHSNPAFLVTNRKLYVYFQEWTTSIHRQEGVSCSDCHGGDPTNPDEKGAHAGDLSASMPRSAVNFENIPPTCGECHEEVYRGYRQSPHFEHLIASETEAQGPNCVTCHGSINSAALNVNTVKDVCLRCHNDESDNHPEIPDQAKLLLNKFLSINRYYRYITIRGEPTQTREFFEELDAEVRSLSVDWHTFDLEKIEERTQKVLLSLREKRKEVRREEVERREREKPPVPAGEEQAEG